VSPGAIIEHLAVPKLAAQMRAMRTAGVMSVRVDVFWPDAEPSRGRFRFCRFDQEVEAARRAGLSVLLVLAYPVSWSAPGRRAADFADFARAVAARYSPLGVHAYELWNEPNLGGTWWAGGSDAGAYATLAIQGRVAVLAADPRAEVVTGALANAGDGDGNTDPAAFIRPLLQAAGADAGPVSVHPYTFPQNPRPGAGGGWGIATAVHQEMLAYGDNASVWVTEFGAPTSGSGRVDSRAQAEELSQAIELTRATPWISHFYVFSWQDNSLDPGFGLRDFNGLDKPAYRAFVTGIRAHP
jgi:hypothetical protein